MSKFNANSFFLCATFFLSIYNVVASGFSVWFRNVSSLSRTSVYCLYNKCTDWHTGARKHKQNQKLIRCYCLRLAHVARIHLVRTIHGQQHTCSCNVDSSHVVILLWTSQSNINGVNIRINSHTLLCYFHVRT